MLSNTLANIPATALTGTLFIATDTFALYRYDGSTWALIGGPGTGAITGTLDVNRVVYATGSNTVATSANLLFDGTTLTTVNDVVVNGITIGKGNNNQSNNTVVGLAALANNVSGTRNTAIGVASLNANTTGIDNVAVGGALVALITGSENVSIGVESGSYAGIGFGTLVTNTNRSVYLGRYARASAATGNTNEIVVGYDALGNGSNTVTIGNNNITANYFKGEIRTTGRFFTNNTINVLNGTNTSTERSAIRIENLLGLYGSGLEGSAGGEIFINSLPYSAVIGNVNAYATHIATSNLVRVTVDLNGKFGIGTTAPTSEFVLNSGRMLVNTNTDNLTDTLQVNGSGHFSGHVTSVQGVNSLKYSNTIPTATWTTIYTIPSNTASRGVYSVYANYLDDSGGMAFLMILNDRTFARSINGSNGASVELQLSGKDIQVRQSYGVDVTINTGILIQKLT